MKPQLVNPVSWTEGMLLTPQHFQQSEVYWQHQLWSLMSQVQPYFWGVRRLNLKADELAAGQIRIIDLDAVMPDGLAVQTAINRDIEKITEKDSKNDEVRTVYLCVPKRNADIDDDGLPVHRFAPARGSLEADDHRHARMASVDRVRPLIELRAGDNTPGRFERLPLFKVRKTGSGFVLTDYHPPLLNINASTFLSNCILQRLRDLVSELRRKARLACSIDEFRESDDILKLAGELPAMEILTQSEVHPFQIYLSLARLSGHVVALSAPYLVEPAQVNTTTTI